MVFGARGCRSRGITAEARFTHPIEIWYTTDRTQESPCQLMLRSECCTGYWLAGKPIIALVDKILAAKKENPTADTSKWEAEIDEKVFDLYDLTPDEREIVKGGGK